MSTSSSRITAAEYGRLQVPTISKSGMSRLIGRGLPVYEGQDDHGRNCKFVDPVEADQWRTANCTPKIDGEGNLRGLPSGPAPPSAGQKSAASPGVAPERPSESPARSRPAILRGGEGGSDGDSPNTASISQRIAEAKAAQAEDQAATSRLRRLKEEGGLVDRDKAIDVQLEFVGMVSTTLERMPADNATLLADTLGVNEHKAYRALQRITEKLRTDLARLSELAHERARSLGRDPTLGDDGGGHQAEA